MNSLILKVNREIYQYKVCKDWDLFYLHKLYLNDFYKVSFFHVNKINPVRKQRMFNRNFLNDNGILNPVLRGLWSDLFFLACMQSHVSIKEVILVLKDWLLRSMTYNIHNTMHVLPNKATLHDNVWYVCNSST